MYRLQAKSRCGAEQLQSSDAEVGGVDAVLLQQPPEGSNGGIDDRQAMLLGPEVGEWLPDVELRGVATQIEPCLRQAAGPLIQVEPATGQAHGDE